jgi:hypothetical protein
MIGRTPSDREESSVSQMRPSSARSPDRELAVRWGVGCLVATVALAGMGLLVLVLSLALQPPPWVQIAVGVVLVLGGVLLAWLVAAAVGRSRARARTGGGS